MAAGPYRPRLDRNPDLVGRRPLEAAVANPRQPDWICPPPVLPGPYLLKENRQVAEIAGAGPPVRPGRTRVRAQVAFGRHAPATRRPRGRALEAAVANLRQPDWIRPPPVFPGPDSLMENRQVAGAGPLARAVCLRAAEIGGAGPPVRPGRTRARAQVAFGRFAPATRRLRVRSARNSVIHRHPALLPAPASVCDVRGRAPCPRSLRQTAGDRVRSRLRSKGRNSSLPHPSLPSCLHPDRPIRPDHRFARPKRRRSAGWRPARYLLAAMQNARRAWPPRVAAAGHWRFAAWANLGGRGQPRPAYSR